MNYTHEEFYVILINYIVRKIYSLYCQLIPNNVIMTAIAYQIIFTWLILQQQINVWPVVGDASNERDKEVNMRATFEQSQNKGHVLFFHHAGTTSHINVLKSLATGLLNNGHKVTTAFYGKTNIAHENYTEIFIKDR